MKPKDLAALAALAGGALAFKSKADKDYAELPEQKEVAKRRAEADDDVSGSKFLEKFYDGMKKGGKVKSASVRADGIAQRGKTKGTMIMCGGGMTKGKK